MDNVEFNQNDNNIIEFRWSDVLRGGGPFALRSGVPVRPVRQRKRLAVQRNGGLRSAMFQIRHLPRLEVAGTLSSQLFRRNGYHYRFPLTSIEAQAKPLSIYTAAYY